MIGDAARPPEEESPGTRSAWRCTACGQVYRYLVPLRRADALPCGRCGGRSFVECDEE